MIHTINQWLWGAPLILLLIAVGLFLTFRLKYIQLRYFGLCHKLAFMPHKDKANGDISQFEAFSTSLASSIGIGSIAGVAVAVTEGGLGALFWMWIIALLGMPLKYAESFLSIKFRQKDANKEMCGGPMLYLEQGLKSKKLAILFALLLVFSSLGIGNLVQVNAIAEALESTFAIPVLWTGIGLSLVVGSVIIGGVKSIGRIASILVPVMGLFFVGGALLILILNYQQLGGAFKAIITSAWQPKSLFLSLMMGAAQGIFSSEAGLGVAGIAASSAKVKEPKEQSLIQMSTVSITTLLICTLMGLVIATTGALDASLSGSKLSLAAFENGLPFGKIVLICAMIPFAYSTMIAWSYYAERGLDYLLGTRSILPFRLFFALLPILGSIIPLQLAWDYAHLANGLMILPNLVGLICLSKLVAKDL